MTSILNSSIQLASLPENIIKVEVIVNQLKADMGLSDEMEANILVSLTEAVNNAIYHGNRCDGSKQVTINLNSTAESLVFSVSDEGAGFDTENVSDPTSPENIDKPTGRGIFLMRSLADQVEFLDGGKKVQISFRRA
jgi:serine/threonine-protein kinase RsbW